MNKKIVILCLMVLVVVGGICLQYNSEVSDLDKRFDIVNEEVESYGGAMVVKYDIETGEIISKRPAHQPIEAGVFTVRTQEEADSVLGKLPHGVEVFIIEEDVSPQKATEAGSNI